MKSNNICRGLLKISKDFSTFHLKRAELVEGRVKCKAVIEI